MVLEKKHAKCLKCKRHYRHIPVWFEFCPCCTTVLITEHETCRDLTREDVDIHFNIGRRLVMRGYYYDDPYKNDIDIDDDVIDTSASISRLLGMFDALRHKIDELALHESISIRSTYALDDLRKAVRRYSDGDAD